MRVIKGMPELFVDDSLPASTLIQALCLKPSVRVEATKKHCCVEYGRRKITTLSVFFVMSSWRNSKTGDLIYQDT